MRDLFYKELKKVNEEILALKDNAETGQKKQSLLSTFNKILDLAQYARKEGVLALEERIFELKVQDKNEEELSRMITLVIDGSDPNLIWDICLSRYFSAGLTDYEGLRYLMSLQGALAIQDGDNPYVVENKLIVLLPEEIREAYGKSGAGDDVASICDMSRVKALCEGELPFTPNDNGYFVMKLADCVFRSIDNHSIRWLLSGWDQKELCVCLRGLSGEARERIFDNLSDRMSLMLAEEMEYLGPARVCDLIKEMMKMLQRMRFWMQNGTIHYEESEAFELFCTIYDGNEEEEETMQNITKLKTVFEEYASEGRRI